MSNISTERAKEVAGIILFQLGGQHALKLMTGANNFRCHTDEGCGALSFRFKGSRKTNYLKIILTPMDTYTLRFGKVARYDYHVVESVEDVYCDSLRDVFTRVTGLELRVPRIVGINA